MEQLRNSIELPNSWFWVQDLVSVFVEMSSSSVSKTQDSIIVSISFLFFTKGLCTVTLKKEERFVSSSLCRVWTSLSGPPMPCWKGKNPTTTILVCAMQKCHFVLPADAKVYVKGNQLAIFPRKIMWIIKFSHRSWAKQKSCELMFATIKIQWTLSSEEKHRNMLRFCQDTIMSRHDV